MTTTLWLPDFSRGPLSLSTHGEWSHAGEPFQNEKLAALFHKSIIWNAGEQLYSLKIGPQEVPFEYTDTAYFVCSLLDIETPWQILLLDQTCEVLNPNTLSMGSDGCVYTQVKQGHPARFLRQAFQQLAPHFVSEHEIEIGGVRYPLTAAKKA